MLEIDYSSARDLLHVGRLPNLRELIVGERYSDPVTFRGLAALANLTNLELVYVGGCFTDDALANDIPPGPLSEGAGEAGIFADKALTSLRGLNKHLRSLRLSFYWPQRISRTPSRVLRASI